MAYQTGRWWSGNAWTSKRFSKRWELFGNVWKRLFLIVGDQHCLRSTFLCLKLWKPILCEATKPKDESVFDTRFEASVGFIKRSCRGAVRVGLKPIAASHFRLFFEDFISTGSQKTGKCASSTLTRLTQNWFPKFQAKKCGSQTMLISNNEKEAFPNISKQFPPFAESLWCPCIPAPSSARLICHLCLNKTLHTSRT